MISPEAVAASKGLLHDVFGIASGTVLQGSFLDAALVVRR